MTQESTEGCDPESKPDTQQKCHEELCPDDKEGGCFWWRGLHHILSLCCIKAYVFFFNFPVLFLYLYFGMASLTVKLKCIFCFPSRATRRKDIPAAVCWGSYVTYSVPGIETHGPVPATLRPNQMLSNLSQCNHGEKQETEDSACFLTHGLPQLYKYLVICMLCTILIARDGNHDTCQVIDPEH